MHHDLHRRERQNHQCGDAGTHHTAAHHQREWNRGQHHRQYEAVDVPGDGAVGDAVVVRIVVVVVARIVVLR